MASAPSPRWLLAALATGVTVIALAMGLSAIDPPWTARQRRLDEQRIQHLRLIADAVDRYWTQRHALPETLWQFDGLAMAKLTINDPFRNEPYEYRREGDDTFLLCATFSQDDPAGVTDFRAGGTAPRRWQHGSGHQCFRLHARILNRPPGG